MHSVQLFAGYPETDEDYFSDVVQLGVYGETRLPNRCQYWDLTPSEFVTQVDAFTFKNEIIALNFFTSQGQEISVGIVNSKAIKKTFFFDQKTPLIGLAGSNVEKAKYVAFDMNRLEFIQKQEKCMPFLPPPKEEPVVTQGKAGFTIWAMFILLWGIFVTAGILILFCVVFLPKTDLKNNDQKSLRK